MYFFSSDAEDNEHLGQAVLEVIKFSRQVALEDFSKISSQITVKQYNEFFAGIMKKYKYKTKRELFLRMKSVSIFKINQDIEFSPSRHVGLQSWFREKGDGIENIVIPFLTPPVGVGQALRLAFERCK